MISGLRTLAAAILLWTIAAPAVADWTAEDLSATLKSRDADQVRFKERRDISYLSQPLVSEGIMRLEDGVLIKSVTAPEPETFEVRDKKIVHIAADKSETRFDIAEHPVLQALAVTLRAVLDGDLAPLRTLLTLEVSGAQSGWTLRMSPRDGPLRDHLRDIVIEGRGADVGRIAIDQRNGDKTVIQIEHE